VRPWIGYFTETLSRAGGGGGATALTARGAMDGAQWRALHRWIVRSGLAGFFFAAWKAPGAQRPPGLPAPLLADLERRYYEYLYKSLLASRAFALVSEALARDGIEHIPVKGVEVARSLYPDPGWREITDVDLLVRRGDLPRADALLREAGMRPEEEERVRRAQPPERFHHGYAHEVDGNPVRVELHGNFLAGYLRRLPWETAWESWTVPLAGGSGRERELRPHARLVLFALHAAKHGCALQLKWLMDILLLLGRHDLMGDCDEVASIIDENACWRPFSFVCALLRSLPGGGRPFPGDDALSRILARQPTGAAARAAIAHLARPDVFLERCDVLWTKWPGRLFQTFMQDDAGGVIDFWKDIALWKAKVEAPRLFARGNSY